jgi:hypothetical protein
MLGTKVPLVCRTFRSSRSDQRNHADANAFRSSRSGTKVRKPIVKTELISVQNDTARTWSGNDTKSRHFSSSSFGTIRTRGRQRLQRAHICPQTLCDHLHVTHLPPESQIHAEDRCFDDDHECTSLKRERCPAGSREGKATTNGCRDPR